MMDLRRFSKHLHCCFSAATMAATYEATPTNEDDQSEFRGLAAKMGGKKVTDIR